MCDRKKNNARWERQVMNRWWTKSKEKVWEVVNKKRKREKDINKEIEIREWDEYFREVMEGEEKNGKRKRIKKKEVRKGFISRCEEVLKKTTGKIRVGKEWREKW